MVRLGHRLVVRSAAGLGVLVAEAGRARFHPLPGAVEGLPAPVAGLSATVPIVVEGLHALEDGTPLKTP
jgi:hypothetical protein